MAEAVNVLTIEIHFMHARQDNANLERRISRAVHGLYDALDLDRVHENPKIQLDYDRNSAPKWKAFEDAALQEPTLAVFVHYVKAGKMIQEAAAIGAALELAKQNATLRKAAIEQLENAPQGFESVRRFLQGIIDFDGTIPPARAAAREALELLGELTRRREAAVHG